MAEQCPRASPVPSGPLLCLAEPQTTAEPPGPVQGPGTLCLPCWLTWDVPMALTCSISQTDGAESAYHTIQIILMAFLADYLGILSEKSKSRGKDRSPKSIRLVSDFLWNYDHKPIWYMMTLGGNLATTFSGAKLSDCLGLRLISFIIYSGNPGLLRTCQEVFLLLPLAEAAIHMVTQWLYRLASAS